MKNSKNIKYIKNTNFKNFKNMQGRLNFNNLQKINYATKREYSTVETVNSINSIKDNIKDNIKDSIKDSIKDTNKDTKIKLKLRQLIGGAGYTSYKNLYDVGNIEELLENSELLLEKIQKFLSSLNESKTYTVLSVVRWSNYETGYTKGITMGKSFKITRENSGKILVKKIINEIIGVLSRYGIESSESELVLMYREWLDLSNFNCNLSTVSKTIDEEFSKELNKKCQNTKIKNRLEKILLNSYNSILMNKYGTEILENGQVIGYKLLEDEGVVVNRVVDSQGVESNLVTVKEIINGKLNVDGELIKWKDTKTFDGFVRDMDNLKIYFNEDGGVIKTEGEYNFPNFPVTNIDFKSNLKLGALDFETFGENGLGNQSVYAGGWGTEKINKYFYIEEAESSLNVVKRTIESIFEHPELDGYTFFAHNLGRFDSLFLIRAAVEMEDITIKPIWKDNSIISLSIKHKKSKQKIKILDSIQFIKGSLREILESFNCKVRKDYFPYRFVNKNNLFYKGPKPNISYFDNTPSEAYDKIPLQWDLKAETLNYLESDIKGLLEFITKFSESTFKNYSLNITKFSTAPAVSLGIFTSGFYDEDKNKIKMVKGKVEEDIRQSYFGGNVEVFVNETFQGFGYDMNSQYPKAMLNDMPVGNPIYTTDKNLENIFGFVYGKVTPPSVEILRVPFIQYRDPSTGSVSCPRGEFYRMIFSEEIKYAIEQGYKFEVIYAYKFNRGKGLFKEFVEKHYELKKTACDPLRRNMSKLLLNSLYGKFGMKEQDNKLKIMSVESANKIQKNYNYSIFANLNKDKVLVRYSSRINESLRKLFKEQENTEGKYKMNEIGLGKNKGVNSAVQIASAIASYARMSINVYKNIPGNPCIMSDTDSIVLPYELEAKEVGPELGQMKLEYEIKHGIFIRKKRYAIKTSTDKIIIKVSGANKHNLNFNHFIDLLKGKNVKTKRLSFNVDWAKLEVHIVESTINLQGLVIEPIRILNKQTLTQTKAISFPKAYPLIIYSVGSDSKIKDTAQDIDKGNSDSENVVINLPSPTELCKELSNWDRNYIMYKLLGYTIAEQNTLQANRILSNIKKIIDKINELN